MGSFPHRFYVIFWTRNITFANKCSGDVRAVDIIFDSSFTWEQGPVIQIFDCHTFGHGISHHFKLYACEMVALGRVVIVERAIKDVLILNDLREWLNS